MSVFLIPCLRSVSALGLLAAFAVGSAPCQAAGAVGTADVKAKEPVAVKTGKGSDAKGGPEVKSTGKAGGRGGRGGGLPQAVEVTPLLRRDLAETLRVVGSLAPNETATIRPETTGLIRMIHFEEG
jgi:multidrug efflux pump subunit AcrA (membrane-fusion protein)